MSGQRMQLLLTFATLLLLVFLGLLGWGITHQILQKPDSLSGVEPGTIRSAVLTETPLHILENNSRQTVELQTWASRWQGSSVNGPFDSQQDLLHLEKLISQTDLPAIAQLRIAKLSMDVYDDDTAAIWARSGVFKAERELGELPPDDPNVRDVLEALKPLERPLSKQQDPVVLEKYWALLTRIPREGDSDIQSDWRRISHAGWLVYLGRCDEALNEIKEIRSDRTAKYLELGQCDEMLWLEGLAYYKSGGINQALPMLKTVAGDSRNPHAREATKLLVQINSPKTPLAVLQGHPSKLAKLEQWAISWQAAGATSRPNAKDQLVDLKGAIEVSDLGALERLRIGQIVEQGGDQQSAVLWYQAGIDQAQRELDAAQHGHNESSIAMQTLTPLLPGLDAAKALFWTMPDSGPWEEKLIKMELILPRVDQWDQDPEWRRIGHGESLYMQRRYTEAMTVADGLENDSRNPANHFTEQQKIGILWLRGLILFDTKHYEKALPYFAAVADCPSFHHSQDAFLPLVLSLLLTPGKGAKAVDAYQEYLRRYGPGKNADNMAYMLNGKPENTSLRENRMSQSKPQ